jgi:hypothetical protein
MKANFGKQAQVATALGKRSRHQRGAEHRDTGEGDAEEAVTDQGITITGVGTTAATWHGNLHHD